MKIMTALPLVITSILLAGCPSVAPPYSSSNFESGQSYWMNYDASRRGAFLINSNNPVHMCAEPAPDVALSFANSLKSSLTVPNGPTGNIEAALNATAQALQGRDEVVLLAREALFRICEASANKTINRNDVRPLFQDVFQQIKEIAVSKAQKAHEDATKAQADAQKANTQLQIMQVK